MAVEKEKIVRSRTVSFRDIHIAKVTTNTETEYTAETPSKLARAITGKISDEFETEKIYSDDSVEDVNMSYKGTSVEAVLDRLPTAKILDEKDGIYTISAEVFGKGIDMWLRSQGDYIKEGFYEPGT